MDKIEYNDCSIRVTEFSILNDFFKCQHLLKLEATFNALLLRFSVIGMDIFSKNTMNFIQLKWYGLTLICLH